MNKVQGHRTDSVLSLGTDVGKDNQIVNEASTQSVFKHSERGEIGANPIANCTPHQHHPFILRILG